MSVKHSFLQVRHCADSRRAVPVLGGFLRVSTGRPVMEADYIEYIIPITNDLQY